MYDDYYSHRCFPASTSTSSASSSSPSTSSNKLSLKNFHVVRRAAATNTANTTAALDIAHLLDPAYHSPKQHAAFMSSNQVYVDTAGETHDPDFRLFAPATHSPKRREFLNISSTNNDDEDDEDYWGQEEKEDSSRSYRQHRSSFDSYRSPSRASDPIYTYSNYRHYDRSYAYRPTNEWQEEPDVFYLSEEERQPRSQTRSRRELNKLRRKRAESESLERREEKLEEEVEDMDVLAVDDEKEKSRQTRSMSPLSGSTTHSFRRQWLALTLRTQFAAFRARRKMTKLVKCATAAA